MQLHHLIVIEIVLRLSVQSNNRLPKTKRKTSSKIL